MTPVAASGRVASGFSRTGSALSRRLLDVRDALTTRPSADAWRRCALLYILFLVCALPIGLLSGLLHPSRPPLTAGAAAIVACTIALHPALTEELVFRALMLPRRLDRIGRGRLLVTIAIALFLYVIAHPLNAKFFWPAVLGVFSNPYYLALATLLGLTCTAAYLISGSIWPSVVIHWLTVTLWILLLGGQALLQSGV
jgi:predicted Abi (CAAX) family protease